MKRDSERYREKDLERQRTERGEREGESSLDDSFVFESLKH